MSEAKGNQSQLMMDFESSFGSTPETPEGKLLPFNSNDVSGDQNQEQPETITGSRSAVQPIRGNMSVSGNITIPIDVRNIGWWLTAMFGAPDTSGSDPYTHVFKMSPTQPSMVLEKGFTDIGQYFLQNGCKVGSFELADVSGDGELTATVGIEGQTESRGTSTFDDTATQEVFERFHKFQAALQEGGSSFAKAAEFSLSLGFDLETDKYTIGNNGQRYSIPEGLSQITGSITGIFDDSTLVDKAINNTETSLNLKFTNGAHSLEFDMTEVQYNRTSPGIDGPRGIVLPLDFTAYNQDGADDSSITVTLINDVTSYTL